MGQWEADRGAHAAGVDFDPPAFEHGRAHGRALVLADAVDYVLSLD